jgi:ribosome biogenesis protein UTP30
MPNIPMPAQVEKPVAAASTSKAPAPLPQNFSKDQAKKAVKALLAHHVKDKERQEEKTLISKDEHIWLVINTRRMPTKKSNKPSRM